MWRQGRSSPAQRQLIAKALGINLDNPHHPNPSELLDPNKAGMREWSRIRTREDVQRLTKGQAGDFITRLKSGAKASYICFLLYNLYNSVGDLDLPSIQFHFPDLSSAPPCIADFRYHDRPPYICHMTYVKPMIGRL